MAITKEKKLAPDSHPSFIRKFLQINVSFKIERVDNAFLNTNIPGTAKREAEVVRTLQFLGLISSDGTPTDRLASLRATGDDFKTNLRAVVEFAYKGLLSKVEVKSVKRESLLNYFIREYNLSKRQADLATRLFVTLCEDSGIALSPEIPRPAKPKVLKEVDKTKGQKPRRVRSGKARVVREGGFPTQIGFSIVVDQNTSPEIMKRVLKLLDRALGTDETGEDD